MPTYISILRGINVSGQKKIKMADLKALYESIGLENVTTYIQSGNVIFNTPQTAQLSTLIEKKIQSTYAFDVPVLIIESKQLKKIITKNPFLKDKTLSTDKLHVTFLEYTPSNSQVKELEKYNNGEDQFFIIDNTVYLYCPSGYGNTKLNNTFFEKKLKTKATTRNWNTCNALLKIIEEQY